MADRLTDDQLAELERLADAAAKESVSGKWFTVDPPWGDGTLVNAGNPDPHGGGLVCDTDLIDDVFDDEPDPDPATLAAFIAAADPDTVRALVADLRGARDAADHLAVLLLETLPALELADVPPPHGQAARELAGRIRAALGMEARRG